MPGEKQNVGGEGAGENQKPNNPQGGGSPNQPGDPAGGAGQSNQQISEEVERLKKELEEARADVSKYQGEADKLRAKLSEEEKMKKDLEEAEEKIHRGNLSAVREKFPEVHKRWAHLFEGYRGEPEETYLKLADELQKGLQQGSGSPPSSGGAGEGKPKEDEQSQPGSVKPSNPPGEEGEHIFTRAEIKAMSKEEYEKNKKEINRQIEQGLIR